jgi:hypothetical protein
MIVPFRARSFWHTKSVGRSDDSGGVLHAGQARSRGAQVTARL